MEKTYISTQKFALTSPRKLRLVVGMIKGLSPLAAIEKLPFAQKRAADVLSKVVRSAVANARNQGANDTDLIFKEIQIGEGPRLKRGRAASRGRWHPYKKRMSHIRVVLTTLNKQISNDKSQINTKGENSKSQTKKKEKNVTKS